MAFNVYNLPETSPFRIADYGGISMKNTNDEISAKYELVTKGFRSGKTLEIDFRREQLRNLYYALHDNIDIIGDALEKDLHRSPLESEIIETQVTLTAIKDCINNVAKWAKPESRSTSLMFRMGSPQIVRSPLGTVLIISPWNYPIYLTFPAIAAAIAAGNTVILKPTEILNECTRAITRALEQALDPEVLQVVNGAVPEATHLLEKKFDKIMVTGSTQLGRIVYKAAAKQLTPVLLELGGKSPVLVGKTANIKTAARRLVWGKLANGGQTCVAPDYVIVEEQVEQQLITEMKKAFVEFYPQLSASSEFTHISSDRLFARFKDMMEKTKGNVELDGEHDEKSRFFHPSFVSNVNADDILMQDEIFGPILPILKPVNSIANEGVEFIVKHHDTPLALYIFSQDKKEVDYIIAHTRSGGVVVNDTLIHVGCKDLPFGGVGESGIGNYHGFYGFEAFSHQRAVMHQPYYVEGLLNARYAPLTLRKIKLYQLLAYSKPWFSRTGPVRRSLFKRLFGGKYVFVLIALITALLYLS